MRITRPKAENYINTLRTKQNGSHRADDIFKQDKYVSNCFVLVEISRNFAPDCVIDNESALVQIVAWCPTGDTPLLESTMAYYTDTYTRTMSQWVNHLGAKTSTGTFSYARVTCQVSMVPNRQPPVKKSTNENFGRNYSKFCKTVIIFNSPDFVSKIWRLCLVPTSTTRLVSDVGYRIAKKW